MIEVVVEVVVEVVGEGEEVVEEEESVLGMTDLRRVTAGEARALSWELEVVVWVLAGFALRVLVR